MIGGAAMRIALSLFACVLVSVGLLAQTATLKLEPIERQMPSYIVERLSAQDRVLFDKLMRVGLESAWSLVTAEGYPQNFINELSPLKPNTRMVGRARTMRYLPNRKDVRDKLYSAGPQLNYKSAEEAQPGDVLVFDAGGETRAGVSGGVTTIRFLVRGGAGLIIDGAMRDVPELEAMPIQTYMRRGHASSVAPLMMSVDYQVPVRIGSVTVIPGDLLVGESTGILVIPAAIADKIADKALEHDEEEEFQRGLLLKGESIVGVYPMNAATRKRFEAWKAEKVKRGK
jgi:5-oxopent-3-ene-1,2,5-tricarboxylate decarboxylase / 2-hydroxyhepta-2,4-diene-1,7-dioate isomerase